MTDTNVTVALISNAPAIITAVGALIGAFGALLAVLIGIRNGRKVDEIKGVTTGTHEKIDSVDAKTTSIAAATNGNYARLEKALGDANRKIDNMRKQMTHIAKLQTAVDQARTTRERKR